MWYYPGQPVTGTGGPLSTAVQLYVSALNPAGYWALGDSQNGSCLTTAADASGQGDTGTLNGTATCEPDPAGAPSQPNPTMVDSFDGTSGFVSTASPALATGTGKSFTVSAWVYMTKNTQFAAAVSQDTAPGDSGGATNSAFMLMYRVSDNVWALSRPSANTPGASVISAESSPLTSASLNTWTQLTGTYNVTNGLMSIYVNGQLQGTATDVTPFPATGSTIIGRDLFSGAFDDFFPGAIKDVQLYNFAFTAPQVAALYQAPVASFPMDGPVTAGGSTTPDITGDGFTAGVNGGLSFATDGAFGTVASLDGTTGFAATTAPVLATGPGKSFSVSAWVFMTKNTQFGAAVSQDTSAGDTGGSTNSAFKLMYRVSDNVWALSRPSANTPGASVISAESSPLTSASLNTWTQLTGTYNASSGLMSIYVNGQLQGTATDTTPFAATGSTIIGRDLFSSTFDDFFPGKVSDVQLFGYS